MEYRKGLTFILIIASVIMCGYLVLTSAPQDTTLCVTGGCDTVKNSEYGQIAGIPLAHLGLTSFLFLLLVFLLDYKKIIPKFLFLKICLVGSALAIYFIYIQIYVLKAICSNCMFVDISMLIITGIAIFDYLKQKQ